MEKRSRRIDSRFDVFRFSPLISAAWVFWDENQICTGNYVSYPAMDAVMGVEPIISRV